jgi:RteC protein
LFAYRFYGIFIFFGLLAASYFLLEKGSIILLENNFMEVKHLSIEPYMRLLQSMEADLRTVEQEAPDGDQYRNVVQVVILGIRELGKLVANGLVKEEEAIALFREACIFDAMSLRLDHELATIANHTATWAAVYKRYFDFLKGQNPEEGQRMGRTKGWKFEWKKSRSAAVEIIKAQAITESVYVNGIPATAAQLVAKWEDDYEVDLRDFNKFVYAMDARKTDPTPYLTELINGLLGRKKILRK